MAETPTDPLKDVKAFRANAASTVGLRVYDADDVDRALAAERAQHQQEIERLEREHKERRQYYGQERLGLMQAIEHRESVVTQRDETIRQLQVQIATLTQERDALATRLAWQVGDASELAKLGNLIEEWTRADALKHGEGWDSRALKAQRANELIHRVNATLEAAEARCATLTAALERIERHTDCACEHDSKDCCATLPEADYNCPGCLAYAARAAAPQGGSTK